MKTILSLLGLLCAASLLRADVNYNIAKDQARRARDQSVEASGGAQPPPPAANAPKTPPVDPALQATLNNIASLRADIAAFNADTTGKIDAAARAALLNDLTAAAQGTKAASADVQRLAGHLIPALLGKTQMKAMQANLARDLHAAFNGAHLNEAQQKVVFDDVKKILVSTGTTADDASTVVDDLKQIAIDTK